MQKKEIYLDKLSLPQLRNMIYIKQIDAVYVISLYDGMGREET
ncbi:MAG: hypothetical protein ACC651_12790 [Candidatus Scalindua sp.]